MCAIVSFEISAPELVGAGRQALLESPYRSAGDSRRGPPAPGAAALTTAHEEDPLQRGPVLTTEQVPHTTEFTAQVHTTEAPVRIQHRSFWLDGSVVIGSQAVVSTRELAGALPTEAGSWELPQLASWWFRSARDVGALHIFDEAEGWAACLPDPLGGALAFRLQTPAFTAVSTDLTALRAHAAERGVNLEKSTLFQAERMIFGSGGLVPSSFDAVETVDPFEYLSVRGGTAQIHQYQGLNEMRDKPVAELFEQLRSDIIESTHAVTRTSNNQHIAHLTGGFDSRLVLSALMHQGLQHDVLFFCSGPTGSTDRVVADGLTRSLNLRRSRGSGLSPAPATSTTERLLGPLFSSAGLNGTGPLGRERDVSVTAFGGGYGGLIRTVFGNRAVSSDGQRVDPTVLRKSFLPAGQSSIRPEAVEALASRLEATVSDMAQRYDLDFSADAFYAYRRNRHHFGQGSMAWSRVGARFDPLYSVAGFHLASRLTQSARQSNAVGHDLMEALNRDLLRYPFDRDRFTDDLLQLRKRPSPLKFPQERSLTFEDSAAPTTDGSSELVNLLDSLGMREDYEPTPQERRKHLERANAIGVNYWHIASLAPAQQLLSSALDRVGNAGDVAEFFDLNRIRELTRPEVMPRPEVRQVYSALNSLVWLGLG